MKLPCILNKLAGVFSESLQTGLKQPSISNNDKKQMDLSQFSGPIFCQLVELYKENYLF